MLTHGVAPSGLLLSTMIPVPKDKRASKSDSNNSTIICTQFLIETIEYYNSNNTDCFMLLLVIILIVLCYY